MALRLVKPLHAKTVLHGQEEVETIIDVPFPSTMGGTCFEYSQVEKKEVSITWDPEKVKVLGINLEGSAVADFPWPGSFYITLLLYVNDQLVVARTLRTTGESASWATNIGAYVRNGWNTFKAEIQKPGCNAWVKGLDVYVSFFSNVIPKHKTREQQLMQYLTWGAIGFGAIAFVGLVVVPLIKKR